MDRLLSSDVLLHTFSYLSARDGGRAMCCCRRFVYLIDTLRGGMEPELTALSSGTLFAIEEEEEEEEEERERKRAAEEVVVDTDADEERRAAASPSPSDRKRSRRVVPPRACARRTVTPQHPTARRPKRATSTSTSTSTWRVMSRCVDRIRAPPNVAFIFHGGGGGAGGEESSPDWYGEATRLLPPDTAILGARSHSSIQANCLGGGGGGVGGGGGTVDVESDSDFCCMVGSFPGALFVPFELDTASYGGDSDLDCIDEMKRTLAESRRRELPVENDDDEEEEEEDASYWKVFVVYVVGDGYTLAHTFIERLQLLHPDALIVGGICDGVDVGPSDALAAQRARRNEGCMRGKTIPQLRKIIEKALGPGAAEGLVGKRQHVERACQASADVCRGGVLQMTDGIFGLAVGGEFPGRSIVSRGVRSVTTSADPRPAPLLAHLGWEGPGEGRPGADEERDAVGKYVDSAWSVSESDVLPHKPSIRVIRSVRNDVTGSTMSAGNFVDRSNSADYIGFKPSGGGGEGFTLETPLNVDVDGIYIGTVDGGSVEDARRFLPGAKIDLFELDGEACIQDLDGNLALLREQLRGEKLLGAVMFSCAGRGPMADLLPEDMADATRFARYFPSIPCVGFYGGGEIGPRAMVGGKGVFRRGGASLQGYTAVFLVFVVPAQKSSHGVIDDSLGNIARHMESRKLRHNNAQRLRNDAFSSRLKL